MKKILYIDTDCFFQKIVTEKIQDLFRGSDVIVVENFVDAYEQHEVEELSLIVCNLKGGGEFFRALLDQGSEVPLLVNTTGNPYPDDAFLSLAKLQMGLEF